MPVAISCVTIPVDDLKKSLAFYRDGLGLTPEETDEDHAAFDVDGVYLTLLDRSGFGAYVEQVGNRPAARGNAGMIISYFADSKADVDAIMERERQASDMIAAEYFFGAGLSQPEHDGTLALMHSIGEEENPKVGIGHNDSIGGHVSKGS